MGSSNWQRDPKKLALALKRRAITRRRNAKISRAEKVVRAKNKVRLAINPKIHTNSEAYELAASLAIHNNEMDKLLQALGAAALRKVWLNR